MRVNGQEVTDVYAHEAGRNVVFLFWCSGGGTSFFGTVQVRSLKGWGVVGRDRVRWVGLWVPATGVAPRAAGRSHVGKKRSSLAVLTWYLVVSAPSGKVATATLWNKHLTV